MEPTTLGAALEAEHRDIDDGIEAFLAQTPDRLTATETLVRALTGLRRHIYLEEVFLFPPLKAAGLVGPIFVMERDHGKIWETMDQIDSLFQEEKDVSAVREACANLLELLEKHNAMEETTIYAQADELLNSSAGAALSKFLVSGSMPSGWAARLAR